MRTFLILLASLSLTAAPLAAQQVVQQSSQPGMSADAELLARAQLDGTAAATTVGTGGWFGGGFVSGVLLGLIGTGVTYAMASSSNTDLPMDKRLVVSSQPASYQQLYEKAFADKVKAKRKSSALTGGILGTATLVVLVLSAGSSAQ